MIGILASQGCRLGCDRHVTDKFLADMFLADMFCGGAENRGVERG
jgi:hypothetical protein